jgi:hypothetical protein
MFKETEGPGGKERTPHLPGLVSPDDVDVGGQGGSPDRSGPAEVGGGQTHLSPQQRVDGVAEALRKVRDAAGPQLLQHLRINPQMKIPFDDKVLFTIMLVKHIKGFIVIITGPERSWAAASSTPAHQLPCGNSTSCESH